MLNWIKQQYRFYTIREFGQTPFLWIYAALLTLIYVDEKTIFPAIKFNSFIRVKIKKKKNSLLKISGRLIFEPFLNGIGHTILNLEANSKIIIERDFTLGDGINIHVSESAMLLVKGKESESASGITANAVVMVFNYVEIGRDCIIAWDTFLTDCDWHSIENKKYSFDTIIGDHTWIGVGVKIFKGAVIGQNCIVTANTIVLKGNYPSECIISGNPGKIIKTGIPAWHRDMIDY